MQSPAGIRALVLRQEEVGEGLEEQERSRIGGRRRCQAAWLGQCGNINGPPGCIPPFHTAGMSILQPSRDNHHKASILPWWQRLPSS